LFSAAPTCRNAPQKLALPRNHAANSFTLRSGFGAARAVFTPRAGAFTLAG
jgi:hypothetical protein